MMELTAMRDAVQTRDDFVAYLDALIASFPDNNRSTLLWENKTIPDFLGVLARWTASMDKVFEIKGQAEPNPSWHLFAVMLSIAAIYE